MSDADRRQELLSTLRDQAEYIAGEAMEPLSKDHVEHARRNLLESATPDDAAVLRNITTDEVLAS